MTESQLDLDLCEIRLLVKENFNRSGEIYSNYNGFLVLFDNNSPRPKPGATVTVMITGFLWNKTASGMTDYRSSPKAIFVRPLTDDDILVAHYGFTIDTDATVSARAVEASLPEGAAVTELTPGRLSQLVHNNGTPIPGMAYISKHYCRTSTSGKCRIEGVNNLSTLVCLVMPEKKPAPVSERKPATHTVIVPKQVWLLKKNE